MRLPLEAEAYHLTHPALIPCVYCVSHIIGIEYVPSSLPPTWSFELSYLVSITERASMAPIQCVAY